MGCYVGLNLRVEVDVPLSGTVAGRPGETKPWSPAATRPHHESCVTICRLYRPGGWPLALQIFQCAACQHLLAAGEAVHCQVAGAGIDVDVHSSRAAKRLRQVFSEHFLIRTNPCFHFFSLPWNGSSRTKLV